MKPIRGGEAITKRNFSLPGQSTSEGRVGVKEGPWVAWPPSAQHGGCMDSLAEPRVTAPSLPVAAAAPRLEHYSVLHCTMTLDVQTVVVFAVIVVLLLVNVVLMFFLGTR
ncbi:hypothetical protein lerEdw1_010331 [Lerista edwardsae]|nr:hypothetical protein lerEdw1_010331 [Lerista edwardsae]